MATTKRSLTWKEVFYSHILWGSIGAVREAAAAAHYPFFAFDGIVYETVSTVSYAFQVGEVEDVK